MSEFYYDVMVNKEDYCNRVTDIGRLSKMVSSGRKIVLYAPRRYGKSSLVKNIIGNNFQSKKNHITLYINFMEVQTLEHISERILQALRDILKSKFPLKSSLNSIVEAFRGMALSFSVDAATQLPSIELRPIFDNDKKNISQIFSTIKNLTSKNKLFLIFDEFQDISLIPQAAGILRGELQELKDTPVILLGSKKQMLNKMFASNKSPFFNFGDELSLSSIDPKEWVSYFDARLVPHKISEEAMVYLCEILNHVPNAICEIGAHIKEHINAEHKRKITLSIKDIAPIVDQLLSLKESTYRFQEGQLSPKEQNFMRVIARRGFLSKPTEHSVITEAKTSSGALAKMTVRLTNKGWIEFEETKGYRVSDPLFSLFLKTRY